MLTFYIAVNETSAQNEITTHDVKEIKNHGVGTK
jgi:hypothetical protein